MFKSSKQRILILAPHTDDGELGCGGAINKFIEEGHEVYYAAFSACEISVPKHLPSNILIEEVKKATHVLGIHPENLLLYNYEVRTFSYNRQAILQDLIDLKNKINPHLVFMPSLTDLHQDHGTIAQEALRAFKTTSILSYELPWNNLSFNTTCFISLSEKNISSKVAALAQYESQQHRPYANDEFIRGLARTRGVQISDRYAEVFEVVRWIIA
jgi:LmbE family N-acetylglucosaminyl deacetylase